MRRSRGMINMNAIIYFNWDERREAVEAYKDWLTVEEVDVILACEDARAVWRIVKAKERVELKRISPSDENHKNP